MPRAIGRYSLGSVEGDDVGAADGAWNDPARDSWGASTTVAQPLEVDDAPLTDELKDALRADLEEEGQANAGQAILKSRPPLAPLARVAVGRPGKAYRQCAAAAAAD